MPNFKLEVRMKNSMSVWSFIFSLYCIPAFFMATSSSTFNEVMSIHPLDIILAMTIITFYLGLIGLKDVRR